MNNELPTVLMVEDSGGLAEIYGSYLAEEPIRLLHASSGQEALQLLESDLPNLVLLDLMLPDMDGMAILRYVHDHAIPTAVVIMTGHGSVEAAVQAMRYGAEDFLEKPFKGERLRATVRNALEMHRLSDLVRIYEQEFHRENFYGFIGNSLAMQMVYRMIEACSTSSATVFITGESGTGKELCAEAIHSNGPRKERPFVAVNCAAIPADLIESELFGHRRGAFTGAVKEHEGAVSRAEGGTLFLDEVAEMHLDLQSKLLRFLQTGKYIKVGGSTEQHSDLRIICATNRDPWEEVNNGRFREDLYYRLNVVPIILPPLRDRNGDTLLLAAHFLKLYSEKEGKRFRGFSPEVESILAAYDWPGNVRQLQNAIHNITVLHDGEQVEAIHLPPPINDVYPKPEEPAARPARPSQPPPGEPGESEIRPLADLEREAIERALAFCDDNVPRAAAMLQVHPSTIYRKKQSWDKQ
jgi:two-component system repressor protein LuxO